MKNNLGYTLAELIVAVAVLCVLAAIAAPSYKSTIDSTKVTSTSDLISQLIGFTESEAVNKNRDIYLSIQTGSSQTVCLSYTQASASGHVCDVRSEPIVSGVTVSMADSTGTTLTEISFSGVTGSQGERMSV